MQLEAGQLARRLSGHVETVREYYLSNGKKAGRYWLVGDVMNTPGQSLHVRLRGPSYGPGAAGKWSEYVAVLVMLRICDWVLPRGGLAASTQHNVSMREVA